MPFGVTLLIWVGTKSTLLVLRCESSKNKHFLCSYIILAQRFKISRPGRQPSTTRCKIRNYWSQSSSQNLNLEDDIILTVICNPWLLRQSLQHIIFERALCHLLHGSSAHCHRMCALEQTAPMMSYLNNGKTLGHTFSSHSNSHLKFL